MIEQCGLQLVLRVFRSLSQSGELQNIGISQEIGDGLWQCLFSGVFDHSFLIGGKACAFIKQAFDLSLQLSHGPVTVQAFVFVECSLPRVFEADQFLEVRPGHPHDFFAGKWRWQIAGQ